MKLYFTILLFFPLSLLAQLKFHWTQISGPTSTIIKQPDSANTLVTGLNQVGIYEYEFKISNIFGESKDTCLVTVIAGTLSIKPDSVYHFERPKIKKLDIKLIERTNDIFIQIKSPKYQQIDCFISDMLGRRLAKINMTVKQGTNFVSVPKPTVKGVYLIQFITYFDELITKEIII